jgi:hypothetical protein
VSGPPPRLGSTAYTGVGVAPRGFVGLWPDGPPATFVSLAADAATESGMSRSSWWTTPVACAA